MATFDELSARIAADTADFRSGMGSAERTLNAFERASLRAAASADLSGEKIDDLASEAVQTAGAMQVLGSRTDNAGDQLSQTAVQAGTASAGLNSVSTSGALASGSMLNFSTVLIASVAPALAIVAAAAVPVVAALGGLVTVAGSIIGVGLVGAIGAIATNTERLETQFNSLLSVIRTEMAPVFNDAATVLGALMSSFADIVPELVPARDVINEIASLFEQFGEAVIESLPALVELGVSLTREFLPGMIRLAQDVLPRVPGFLRRLVDVFQRLIPSFSRAGQLLGRLGPELLEFGFTALSVVGPALERVTVAIINGLRAFNNLSSEVQGLSVQLAAVAPIILGLASLIGGPVTLAITGLIGLVVGLRKAWTNNFAGIRDIVSQLGTQIQRVLPAARQAFNAFIEGVNIQGITSSLSDFEQILGTELQQTMVALKPVFGDIQQLLMDNREEFRIIGGAVGNFIEALIGVAQTVIRVYGPVFRNIVIPVIRGFIDLLDEGITQLANFIRLFNALQNKNFSQAGMIGEEIVDQQIDLAAETVPSPQTIQGAAQQAQQTIELIIDENTDITETRIQQGAETVVRRRERRAGRLQNRTG